jgi:adenosylhomocysteine nucleosidase
MKVGIVCAGDEELAPFLPLIENCKITEKSMLKFHEGKINDVEVVALYSGVCKVNAAIATQILIDTFSVNIIINSGTAGGMDPHLEIFDTVISTEVEYHDVAPEILTEFHFVQRILNYGADCIWVDNASIRKKILEKLYEIKKIYE